MVKWTKEQEKAIYESGHDILVAAAAGSGKTAVLVERIIQKLLSGTKPVDIDSLLVVTFTNAAAQEMRNRVGIALEKALADNPKSNHLKKQLSLLQRASISTLHSFCLDIIKKYAYQIDIDPSFRIGDDREMDLIKQEVLDELFEDWYGDAEESFFSVVDRFSNDRSDEDVEKLILNLHRFAMQNPSPDVWLDSLSVAYEVDENMDEDKIDWLQEVKEEIDTQLTAMQMEIEEALAITKESDGPYEYAATAESDYELVVEARSHLDDWEALQGFINTASFTRLSSKKMDCNEEKKEQFKDIRKSYKDRLEKKLKTRWFKRSLSGHLQDMRTLAPVIRQLTELVKQFHHHFQKYKRERGLVDFSDLEHYCLEILAEDVSGRVAQPSEIANRLKGQFTEVLVDEYQDVNLVQETILQLVSNRTDGGNLFMVGDVKQSVYRFRHAEPSLFIEKYKVFAEPDHEGERIDLASNFRSRKDVLSGTNYIFKQILDEELGEIAYDKDAELIYGNKSYDVMDYPGPEVEVMLIDREAAEETEDGEVSEDLEKAQLEARAYTKKIKSWIGHDSGSPMQVFDKDAGTQRDIQYRDIVILMRSMTEAPVIVDELKKQGIPVYAELSSGYFEAIEVKVMISFLKVIDNPRQDIPLASVLKSPIIGMDEDELASIRLADRQGSYYDALMTYVKENKGRTTEKAESFLAFLEEFRVKASQGALSDLIWDMFTETGYYDFVGGIPGGRQRQANLRALYDRARGYETTSFRGLFRFLRFIERMEERGDDLGAAHALSEQEDVVRMITIHRSKGLEFPAVIVGFIDKQFNESDFKGKYFLHKDKGFATKYIDPVKRITYPTLFYQALKENMRKEMLAEEMRVLYVAMTRAREKLTMVGSVPNFANKQKKWMKLVSHQEWILPIHRRMEAKSYLDWIGPALVRHNHMAELREDDVSVEVPEEIKFHPSNWKLLLYHERDFEKMENTSEETDAKLQKSIKQWNEVHQEDPELQTFVDDRLNYQYPYLQATVSRAKQTVTELKRQQEFRDEYSSDQLIPTTRAPLVERPNFMQTEKKVTSAEKGTAMHTVMQHLPMDREQRAEEIEAFVEGLVHRELLTRTEADIVDVEAIEVFLKSDIARKMMESRSLHKELPFSVSLPASRVYADWKGESEENVLIQGVMDCIIPHEDGWIILDYKTDAITKDLTDEVKKELQKRYETQMSFYRYALEAIWKQPVYKTYLYFFAKQVLIEVPEKE